MFSLRLVYGSSLVAGGGEVEEWSDGRRAGVLIGPVVTHHWLRLLFHELSEFATILTDPSARLPGNRLRTNEGEHGQDEARG